MGAGSHLRTKSKHGNDGSGLKKNSLLRWIPLEFREYIDIHCEWIEFYRYDIFNNIEFIYLEL